MKRAIKLQVEWSHKTIKVINLDSVGQYWNYRRHKDLKTQHAERNSDLDKYKCVLSLMARRRKRIHNWKYSTFYLHNVIRSRRRHNTSLKYWNYAYQLECRKWKFFSCTNRCLHGCLLKELNSNCEINWDLCVNSVIQCIVVNVMLTLLIICVDW